MHDNFINSDLAWSAGYQGGPSHPSCQGQGEQASGTPAAGQHPLVLGHVIAHANVLVHVV